MKRYLLAACCLVLVGASPARAQNSSAGTGGASFMKLGMGSTRAMSMGQAYVAIAEGTDAMNWNPAGLALTESREFSYSYMSYIQGVQAPFFMAYAQPLGRTVVGVNADYMSVGGFDVRDANGVPLNGDNVMVRDGYGTLSVARSFWYEKLFLGGSLKDVMESDGGVNQNTVVADLGALIKPTSTISFGLSTQNLGGSQSRVYKITRLGVAKQMLELLNVSFELSKPSDNGWQAGIGGEFTLPEELLSVGQISLRVGYYTSGDQGAILPENRSSLYPLVGAQGLSFGLGLYTTQAFGYGVGLDYALVPMGALGTSDQLTLKLKF